ncbi:hypothetical protein B566_EDAN014695 [Ephemera danica]|nr:hypothetical protein B566_EDAN014695 [Ephemera danica]
MATTPRVENSQLFGILTAIFIVLLTIAVFFLWKRRKGARRGVLLMGLSDCGKTLIFSRILHSRFVHTYTSVKENDALKLIDIPGHERVRAKFFDHYKNTARGIVYVVDSVTLQKDIRDVAEFLYNLLTDPVVVSNCPSFLVVCNKQDQTMAKGSTVIKKLLEKELNTLRTTKSSQLESISESGERTIFLGKESKDFEFEHLGPIRVDFAESTAFNKEKDTSPDLSQVEEWLSKIA